MRWDEAGRGVLDHDGGFLRVIGGPGTGKTTLVAELVADRIRHQRVDPENILVLTTSRRAAGALRTRITRLLTGNAQGAGLRTAREPLVRTVHSYAFGVLRLQSALHGLPPPRLLSGPDQDAVVRELLAGDIDDGAPDWPARLRPALPLPAFAAELRDLLLRAAERGLGPEDLIDLGKIHGHEEWIAAGIFGRQYEQVTLLQGAVGSSSAQGSAPALDAAELVSAALLAFETDTELRATEQTRVRHLYVDDAQHLDPQQFELIRRLAGTSAEHVLLGDPDQAVFSFRGADPRLLADADPDGASTAVLKLDHRMSPRVRTAVARLINRLPGAGAHREAHGPEDEDDEAGRVTVRLFASAAQEASWVADQLRRAHLLDGVPWAEMAVLVRSTVRSLPVLRRALLAAGVPLAVPAEDLPLMRQAVVRPLLELVRAAASPVPLDEDTAVLLLSGPLGGADPLALRRLRRGLRRLELAGGGERGSGALLVEALESADELAAPDEAAARPVRHVGGLLKLAKQSVADGDGVETVLWRLWKASGLERVLVGRSTRGGPIGVQADRDLDAVLVLFDAAARYHDRLPGAGVGGFVEYLSAQQIVGDSLAPSAPTGQSVSVLTAHAAAGREWSVVAVPSVQEGSWPDLRLRGSLLGVEKLVDLVAGIDPDGQQSATAPLLAEERRLLLLAASRAKDVLLVTAVRGEDEQPSRFLDELDGTSVDPEAVVRGVRTTERALVLADVVGELRRVVCAEIEDPDRRERAAAQLARLAAAGVPGADPRSWYGLVDVSTDKPLWTDTDEVKVSPSTVEVLTKCPLRWLVERHGGTDSAELPSITGSLVHALAQAAAEGADPEKLRIALDAAWAAVDAGAPWFSRRERQRIERMVDAFRDWLTASRPELTQVAVEWGLDIRVGPDQNVEEPKPGPWLRVRGRVDRLEADAQGRPVVVDIKTGKNPPTKAAAEAHPQLAVYQLAAALGAFDDLGLSTEPGGARLLYLAKETKRTGPTELAQQPLDEPAVHEWLDVVRDAATACTGPDYTATVNSDCDRCPARTSCPVHSSGRQVGQ
ncbi:MAG TPA: ATP-dependent DNA helicase [Pseudonocardiaceae bacterium]|nr:ATP-dependent DNA helicase [Pseudonocardiaceae bacterium]